MEVEVDSRLVSHTNGRWQASNGPFEHFDNQGETGWSLLAQAVNHWHAPSAELVRPFRVLPDWRLDDLMISFPYRAVASGRILINTMYSSFRGWAAAAGVLVINCR